MNRSSVDLPTGCAKKTVSKWLFLFIVEMYLFNVLD